MPLFKKNQRYKVSRKSDYIQVVTLLDGSTMECNLSVESTATDCLENILQRLEVKEIELFGLKCTTNDRQLRWIDPDKPLRKQLEKHAGSSMVYLGVLYYLERAYALKDDVTRYQYYLQLKADILDGRRYCSLEQAILLAGYILQAEYQNYDDARQSEDYIRDIDRLDISLLPRGLLSEYENALPDIVNHVVNSHMALSGMSTAQSEVAYIQLAQQIDNIGSERIRAETTSGEEVFLFTSPSGIVAKTIDGNIRNDIKRVHISDITCQKRYLSIYTGNKKLIEKFSLVDNESAKYAQKVFQLHQQFYTEDHDYMLYSEEEVVLAQEVPPMDALQTIYPGRLDYGRPVDMYKEVEVDDNHMESLNLKHSDIMHENMRVSSELPPPDLIEDQNDEYATMKYNRIGEDRPRAFTASVYAGNNETPMLDQLHKNDLLHRSMTALQEYKEYMDQTPNTAHSPLANSQAALNQSLHNIMMSTSNVDLNRKQLYVDDPSVQQHAGEEGHDLVMYRPSPDYDTVMRRREMFIKPQVPQAYNRANGYQMQDPRFLIDRYTMLSLSQPDITGKEPLYANIIEQHHNQSNVTKHKSELHLNHRTPHPLPATTSGYKAVELEISNPPTTSAHRLPRHTVEGHHQQQPPTAYPHSQYGHTPDLMNDLQQHKSSLSKASGRKTHTKSVRFDQVPDIAHPIIQSSRGPDIIYSSSSVSHVIHPDQSPVPEPRPSPVISQNIYKSFENLDQLRFGDDTQSYKDSSRASSISNRNESPRGTYYLNMAEVAAAQHTHSAASNTSPSKQSSDDRVIGLEEKLKSDEIAAEYDRLLKKRQPTECRVALSPENSSRNRYYFVLPYDDTRVRLLGTQQNPQGYINANHVNMKVGAERLTYIATQNPLDDTVLDFWTMIWVHNVMVIVMVSELQDRGTQKCPRYWPENPGLQHALNFNDLKVVLKHSAVGEKFTTTCLRVYKMNTKEHRTIWHIQYTDWTQAACPNDVEGFLGLLNECNSIRLHIQSERRLVSPCVLVHCSTGVGRTGVVILSDVMRKCLDNNEKLSIPDALRELRQQRMYMVQTLAQYKFVHEVLIHYLNGVRLI